MPIDRSNPAILNLLSLVGNRSDVGQDEIKRYVSSNFGNLDRDGDSFISSEEARGTVLETMTTVDLTSVDGLTDDERIRLQRAQELLSSVITQRLVPPPPAGDATPSDEANPSGETTTTSSLTAFQINQRLRDAVLRIPGEEGRDYIETYVQSLFAEHVREHGENIDPAYVDMLATSLVSCASYYGCTDSMTEHIRSMRDLANRVRRAQDNPNYGHIFTITHQEGTWRSNLDYYVYVNQNGSIRVQFDHRGGFDAESGDITGYGFESESQVNFTRSMLEARTWEQLDEALRSVGSGEFINVY